MSCSTFGKMSFKECEVFGHFGKVLIETKAILQHKHSFSRKNKAGLVDNIRLSVGLANLPFHESTGNSSAQQSVLKTNATPSVLQTKAEPNWIEHPFHAQQLIYNTPSEKQISGCCNDPVKVLMLTLTEAGHIMMPAKPRVQFVINKHHLGCKMCRAAAHLRLYLTDVYTC